jgi:hypothetical protein
MSIVNLSDAELLAIDTLALNKRLEREGYKGSQVEKGLKKKRRALLNKG